MKLIDLTHTVANGMMIFPGDPEVSLAKGLTHEDDYCHVDRLNLNSHTGTHIDAPYHFITDGKRVTDYSVDKFVGKGRVIELYNKKEGEAITAEDLSRFDILKGDIILLATGWYEFFGSEKYLNHPFISKGAAEYLVGKGVSIVAVDFLNVDPTLYESWEAHPVLLSNDVLIVENVANSLDLQASKSYEFSFLPLKIDGSDGSPVRGIAKEL